MLVFRYRVELASSNSNEMKDGLLDMRLAITLTPVNVPLAGVVAEVGSQALEHAPEPDSRSAAGLPPSQTSILGIADPGATKVYSLHILDTESWALGNPSTLASPKALTIRSLTCFGRILSLLEAFSDPNNSQVWTKDYGRPFLIMYAESKRLSPRSIDRILRLRSLFSLMAKPPCKFDHLTHHVLTHELWNSDAIPPGKTY
ncbi:hypothetical protein Moror_14649 [Moniliophthora roreri MCA 2997]|uniref:Uncharacterized protein n=1 Tax=Moniliophthora roreri (strain MCA 2997) TaxID=1381753 RepID=V2YND8_MONRO|nr:hypothetical protein Moror_14649 [Moniliophthora roreri MCA 2997]